MMNVLDGNPTSSLHDRSAPSDNTVDNAAKLRQPQSRRSRKMNTRRQQQRKGAVPTIAADAHDLPTDVSVTPLPSDERSLSPNPPVKVANKDRFEGHIVERNDFSVRGALAELQQLRGRFADRRLLQVPPPRSRAHLTDKENQENRPPVVGGRLFGALLDSLRQMNPELGGGRGRSTLPSISSSPFRLLRLPSPWENDFPVRLPSVLPSPRPAWESVDFRPSHAEYQPMPAVDGQATQGNGSRPKLPSEDSFPLLHLSESHFPSHGHDTGFPHSLPFPMLQMIDPRHGPVPFFVPPERINIVGHNNNNREMLTARSGMQTARSEPQTGQSDIPTSSQRSIELLRLEPALCDTGDTSESDTRQVLNRLKSISRLFSYFASVVLFHFIFTLTFLFLKFYETCFWKCFR